VVEDDGWTFPKSRVYQAYIVSLMEFFHGGMDYERNQEFTRDDLLELGPNDIKRWMLRFQP
jgi:hypothetical protein